jgi:putative ABC transport system permease protein
MLRDYLRSFWRMLRNNKFTSAINIGGLALGLAVFFALTLYVQREFSWDAQWEDADRIYAVAGRQERPSGNSVALVYFSYYVLGNHLQSTYPEAFEAYARLLRVQGSLIAADEEYSNYQVFYAEPDLLDILQLDVMEGSLQEVFADPRSIAISGKAAQILFGRQSALGQTLTFNSQQNSPADFTIKAVYRFPGPSSLDYMDFLALFSRDAAPVSNATPDSWSRTAGLFTDNYFKLRPGFSAAQLESELRAFMDENHYMETSDVKSRFVFLPLQDVHLAPSNFNPFDNVARLRILAGIGVLVLLISGCNFVMLATLRSLDRVREVGIRKAMGAETGQLLRQYLVDVVLQTLMAATLAIMLLELALPWLQARLNLAIDIELSTWGNLGQGLFIVLIFALLSGIYPALLMSRGQPATLLRNNGSTLMTSGNGLRKFLVGIQFAIVIGLLLASTVLRQQIDYTRNRDRGYNLEHVIGLRFALDIKDLSATLVSEFKRVPGVAGAAVGGESPGIITSSSPSRVMRTALDGSLIEAALQEGSMGADYFNVMSIPILAGREFSAEIEGASPISNDEQNSTRTSNILLNFSALNALGFRAADEAIGSLLTKEISDSDGQPARQDMRVIGVVADTQFASLMLPPVAKFYDFSPTNTFITIRFEPEADQAATTQQLRAIWQQIAGAISFLPLSSSTMEGNTLYQEELEANIVTGSTLLALVIALLGLYGLVEATVNKRTKEIGVRKALGASRESIVALLLWQFSKPVIAANLIAWPRGLWGVMRWLQRFPYQLDLGVILSLALATSLAALGIAWLTIAILATRAASVRPVRALRYE